MTPQQLLDERPVHGLTNVAVIVGQVTRSGKPDRAAVKKMIRDGALALVDNTQPEHRWTVSSAELRRYINEGPRRPLRAVS